MLFNTIDLRALQSYKLFTKQPTKPLTFVIYTKMFYTQYLKIIYYLCKLDKRKTTRLTI
jgi:hypothetical protein